MPEVRAKAMRARHAKRERGGSIHRGRHRLPRPLVPHHLLVDGAEDGAAQSVPRLDAHAVLDVCNQSMAKMLARSDDMDSQPSGHRVNYDAPFLGNR